MQIYLPSEDPDRHGQLAARLEEDLQAAGLAEHFTCRHGIQQGLSHGPAN